MEIVRGHMVVLDLSLPSRGMAALVAQLARVEKSPTVVLLPGNATKSVRSAPPSPASSRPTAPARSRTCCAP
jgi:hypothetical protein